MHIKGINREQYLLLPPRIDDWVPKNYLARVIDFFVEEVIDVPSLGIKEENQLRGRPNYVTQLLLKILLYGYSIGQRSSRKLERLTYENVVFMWISNGLHPDYRTIARFRQNNIKVMKELLKKTIELYKGTESEFDNIIYSDGSKIYANASDDATVTEEKVKGLEEMVEKILKEVEEIDKEEDKIYGENNGFTIKEEEMEKLKEEIRRYKEGLKEHGGRYNSTDEDAKLMKHYKYGKHTSYNGQISVDKNRVILEAEISDEGYDNHLLRDRVKGVEENTGGEVKKVVSDSGYYSSEEIKELMKEVVVPSGEEVGKERGNNRRFVLEDFKYEVGRDVYICPEGKELRNYRRVYKDGKEYDVYIASGEDCKGCKMRERCRRSKNEKRGRQVSVLVDKGYIEGHKRMIEENRELLIDSGNLVCAG